MWLELGLTLGLCVLSMAIVVWCMIKKVKRTPSLATNRASS